MAERRRGDAVVLVNPLGPTLAHYCAELTETLGPREVEIAPGASAPRAPVLARPAWLLRHLVGVARAARSARTVIVCWPLLGAFDVIWAALVSRIGGGEVWVVVHDPEPLRRQVGLGRSAWRAAAGAVRRAPRVRVVSHSAAASAALAVLPSDRVVELPHPMLARRGPQVAVEAGEATVVTVLGQHKAARDLAVLDGIGALAAERLPDVTLHIRGRGWPPVAGWSVDPTFLDEELFTDALERSAAIVVPYVRYFQSGVAVRAVEAGVGVVIPRTDFAERLLGPTYPGLCDSMEPAEWVDAIVAVTKPEMREALLHRGASSARTARERWSAAIDQGSDVGGST
jgi:hypothetical protein